MPTSPTVDQIRERLVNEPLVRSFTIERAEILADDSRTVNLAFASDKPIQQWSWSLFDYMELQLSMRPGAMRTVRLESGAPLLMDHNTRDQVGVVEEFTIEKDGIARANVRFSRSSRGEEIFQDVRDGIRKSVSVGFMVHEMHLEKEREGQPSLYRSDDWEPYEISIVSVPADISVGVGRSKQVTMEALEERAISTNTETTMENSNNVPVTPVEKTRTGEQPPPVDADIVARSRDIVAFAEIFGEGDLARQMIAASTSVTLDDVRNAIKDQKAAKQSALPSPEMPDTIASREGVRTELAVTMPRHGQVTAFKGDDKDKKAYRFGQWLLGRALFDANFQPCIAARKFCEANGLTRAMSEGVNETGGFLVPAEFGNDLIDLREQYGVFRRNAKIVPMASDTRSDPRRTGGLTAYFVAEAGSITASDLGWDNVNLTAKKLAVLARYSSEVNEDSVIDFGNNLANEIAYAFAEKEDQCGFNGDASATYGNITGVREKLKGVDGTIANIAGLQVGSGNAYSELALIDFEGVAARLPIYADTQNAKWYVHKKFYWNVMVKLLLAAGGVTAFEIENARKQIFLGYPVEYSQVMPSTEGNSQVCALLGDLSLAASFGTRRDTQIAFSEHSRFANDQIEVRGTERFDINVHSVGDTSVGGPVVGLITAAS